ncbi:hypothetical protein RVV18_004856 [Burkholderia ambifaria]|nr:hypothetical protein [Burkholderia ambifaria]
MHVVSVNLVLTDFYFDSTNWISAHFSGAPNAIGHPSAGAGEPVVAGFAVESAIEIVLSWRNFIRMGMKFERDLLIEEN